MKIFRRPAGNNGAAILKIFAGQERMAKELQYQSCPKERDVHLGVDLMAAQNS
jgi:hypothetical protein